MEFELKISAEVSDLFTAAVRKIKEQLYQAWSIPSECFSETATGTSNSISGYNRVKTFVNLANISTFNV